MSSRRLRDGGKFDRTLDTTRAIKFTWDGKQLDGFAGDTLASALLANNQSVIARSFKYHRPRGIMSAGVEESGAMVTVGSGDRADPNVKTTTAELFDGLEAHGQNAWPSVRFDVSAVNGLFGKFFAAGFYYKTFMGIPPFEWFSKGTGIWMQYEKIIRKAAGMGTASRLPDPDEYEHGHLFCDVMVVGGGVAGLNAARSSAAAGLDVILIEQDFELGGAQLSQNGDDAKRAALVAEVEAAGVRIMTRTTAFGLYDYSVAGLVERVTDHLPRNAETIAMKLPRQRFWTLRCKQTILATGALERHVAFGNNDRPGIMTAAASGTYLNRHGVLTGDNIVIATNNDSVYQTALDLKAAGAAVNVLDSRARVSGGTYEQAVAAGISVTMGTTAYCANGKSNVSGLQTATGTAGVWTPLDNVDCDSLLLSGGWSPVVNLLSHRGVKPIWNDKELCFVSPEHNEPIQMAGSAAGCWTNEACEASGLAAGEAAAKALGAKARAKKAPAAGGWDNAIEPLYEVRVEGKYQKSFVDPQHDVTTEDIRLAHREGFVSVEHLKRYTTLGMATDQGKMGNIIGLALMAEALGREIPEVGTTTFRPPYTPIAIGALTGRGTGTHFKALRRTAMHDWNVKHGAKMLDVGLWQRPWFFAREGETITEAYIRETETVRKTVGICDVTSLGKIAVQGPDAAKFLHRIYTNAFAKLAIGKARYGIVLRDDGFVMDDGTTWRLSEHDYFMTTTTAHAAKMMVWLEELLQTRWQDLKVHVSSVSEQWAGVAVAGPKAREVIQGILENPDDLSNENCPFMGVIQPMLKNGVQCRIARISFSGEMAYELYVNSDYANSLMDMLWPEAQKVDGCLYGTEALGALRIEKGHVTGAELDGRVTIEDAGLGGMASTKKSYIGSSLRMRPELQKEGRPQLVGILPKDRSQTFNAGSILIQQNRPDDDDYAGEGWVTAVTHSPEMGHWIGLGFLEGGYKAWEGQTLISSDPVRKGDIEVEVISPHMVDPKGERMHG